MTFPIKFFISILFCFFCLIPVSWGCDESCPGGPTDCPDPLCKGCYSENIGTIEEPDIVTSCNDCCIESNSDECVTAGCFWQLSNIKGAMECRNESGVDCSGIPEVPSKSKTWLLIAFSVAGLGLASALRLKKRKAL